MQNKGPKKASMSSVHSRITTFCIVFQRNFKERVLLTNTVRELTSESLVRTELTEVKRGEQDALATTSKADGLISRMLLSQSYRTQERTRDSMKR